MMALLVYSIKSALVLTLLYLPYTLMLRQESFFRMNRITLLTILMLALVLPMVDIPSLATPAQPVVYEMQQRIMLMTQEAESQWGQDTLCHQHGTKYPDPIVTLRYFGGFEMIAAIGAMLRAAELHLIILVDGFIMTACALGAIMLYPASQDYMIFTHCGDEAGHKMMLDIVDAKPLLHLGLRLGEGTGALCAFPIVDSAVRMMNEMNNFDNAQITKYF